MANEGGGGPRIPRNLRPDLESVNSVLQDIGTKLSNIHEMSEFHFDARVEGVDELSRLEKTVQKASVANKLLAKNLGERRKIDVDITKQLKKTNQGHERAVKSIIKLNDLKKKAATLTQQGKNLSIDEQKELKHLIDIEDDLMESEEKLAKQSEILKDKQKKLTSVWIVAGKTLASQLVVALDKLGKALVSLSIDAVFFSLEKLRDGFLKIYDLMERTTKATGQFNLAVGGTTKGLDETRKEAWKVEGQLRALTGGPLGVGLQMWQETSQALGFVGGDFDQIATKATLAGRALGIGSTAAGEISRTFFLMGDTSKDITHNLVEISDSANAAGVSVASFGKEIVGAKNFLTTFGKVGRKVFLDSAAFAKKLGVSVASLEKFTDLTDSFENTAKMAARMNIVFGTSVNAMQLMLEQDPSKRLEMVRNELKSQGKTWEEMNRQERKFFADSMQMSAEEAAAVMTSNMTLDEFQKKQERDNKKKVSDEKKIRDGLSKTAETLMNWGQQFDVITRSMMKMFEPILEAFGLTSKKMVNGKEETKSFGQLVTDVVGKITKFFDDLASDKKFMAFIEDVGKDIKKIFEFLMEPETWKAAQRVFSATSDGVRELYEFGRKVFDTVFTKKNIDWALGAFEFLAGNIEKIVGGFLAFKTVMGVGNVVLGINNMSKLLFGPRGLVGLLVGMAKGMFGLVMKIIPMLASGFMKLVTDVIPKMLNSVGGASGALKGLGVAAGVVGAAMIGWEIGKFIGNLDIAGKSINDWVVIGYEKIAEWGDKLWRAIKDSKLGKMLFGEDNADVSLSLGMQLSSLQSMKRTGKGDFFGTIGQLQENKAALIEMSRGQITEKDIQDAIDRRRAAIAAEKTATTVKTPQASSGEAALPGATPVSKNYATKASPTKTSSSGGMTLIAGDVYLDGDKVGRHLLRGATK